MRHDSPLARKGCARGGDGSLLEDAALTHRPRWQHHCEGETGTGERPPPSRSSSARRRPRRRLLPAPSDHGRRDRLLDEAGLPTRAGFDRDEYPPAVGRGRGPRALTRGINPVGWRADVAYVRSGENRSHGSSLGGKLRRFCNGTKFRYAFR